MDLEKEIGVEDDRLEDQVQLFHVLAVDDSLTDRRILEKFLTVSSYRVTCVDSGNKALEFLGLIDDEEKENINSTCARSCKSQEDPSKDDEKEKILLQTSITKILQLIEVQGSKVNLIITDFSMPGMNGYDLLRKIKGSSWRDIPVVVMSSENVPARINMCLEGGAEEFLLKPVQLSDMKKLHFHILKPIIKQNLKLSIEEEEEEVEEEEEEEKQEEEQGNDENQNKFIIITREKPCFHQIVSIEVDLKWRN